MQDSNEVIRRIHRWDRSYKVFLLLIVLLISVVTFIVLAQVYTVNAQLKAAVAQNRSVNTENNTYLRLNACIVSVPPQRRTPEYVKYCYDVADKYNQSTVTRYGDGK